MIELSFVSLLWAFSFPLIKLFMVGFAPYSVASARLLLSAIVFLPFLNAANAKQQPSLVLKYAALGSLQFGLMYVLYIYSYQFLQAHQVALLTITTPLWVALLFLLDGSQKRNLGIWLKTFACVLLSIVGALIIVLRAQDIKPTLTGVALIQLANFCFALGQVGFVALQKKSGAFSDRSAVAWMYVGAALLASMLSLGLGASVVPENLTLTKAAVLIYLGIVASGAGFFLWNRGATQVKPGVLAVFNNIKIPLGVVVSLIVFQIWPDWPRFLAGTALIVFALLWARGIKQDAS